MLLSLRCTSLFHQHNLTHAKQGQDKVLCIYCIITQQLLVFFVFITTMLKNEIFMFVYTKSSHVYTIKPKINFFCTFYYKIVIKHIFLC
jgi:hypothetical protein